MPRGTKRRGRRPKFICIYKIECTKNMRVYIGSSKDVAMRWNSHIRDMEFYKHSIEDMTVDWHKYGFHAFRFSIVEMLDTDVGIRQREQSIMDGIDPKKLYNKRRATAS